MGEVAGRGRARLTSADRVSSLWTRRRQDRSYRLFALFGIPVHLHWTGAAILAVILALTTVGGLPLVFLALAWFSLILVHELGHASIAYRLGYEVEAIFLAPLHGLCVCEAPRTRYHECLVAWGGVSAQAALFVGAGLASRALGDAAHSNVLNLVFGIFIPWNAVMILFNLAPLAGFDGATAWGILRARPGRKSGARERANRRWRR